MQYVEHSNQAQRSMCRSMRNRSRRELKNAGHTEGPGSKLRNRGQNGQFWWRWVPPIFGVPFEQVFQMSPTPCHTSSGGTPYGAATSTKPCLSDITGSPPSWAHPHSAGPNPPGPGAAQRLSGAATWPSPGSREAIRNLTDPCSSSHSL